MLLYNQFYWDLQDECLLGVKKYTKLLPLQGALLTASVPRALPWAKSFWAFSPFLNHLQMFYFMQDLSSIVRTAR